MQSTLRRRTVFRARHEPRRHVYDVTNQRVLASSPSAYETTEDGATCDPATAADISGLQVIGNFHRTPRGSLRIIIVCDKAKAGNEDHPLVVD